MVWVAVAGWVEIGGGGCGERNVDRQAVGESVSGDLGVKAFRGGWSSALGRRSGWCFKLRTPKGMSWPWRF